MKHPGRNIHNIGNDLRSFFIEGAGAGFCRRKKFCHLMECYAVLSAVECTIVLVYITCNAMLCYAMLSAVECTIVLVYITCNAMLCYAVSSRMYYSISIHHM